MGCYQNNLSLLIMHVESLLELVNLAETYSSADQAMPPALEEYARNAAGLLGRLNGSVEDTYMSTSADKQITKDPQVLSKVNRF